MKYVKGVLSNIHRAFVPIFFAVDYVRLWLMKRRVPGRKFIVINLIESFGDVVACEPVARYVRSCHPNAYIVWTVRRPYRDLVLHNPAIDEVFFLYCITEWIYLASSGLFDEIIDLHLQNRECTSCRKPLLKDSGNTEVTIHNYYNHGNLLAAFCKSAGIPIIEDQPRVYIPNGTIRTVDLLGLPDEFIVVHCSSSEVNRDWMQKKWHLLTHKIISDLDHSVVEIGLQSLLNLKSDRYVNLCAKLSPLETAEIIRRAKLFVGIDSGPAHLANAVGTFGIILLGEYKIFKRYMPFSGGFKNGKNATILHYDGPVSDIPVNMVYEAVTGYFSRTGSLHDK